MPLMHFLDTSLAAYLLKWGNAEALEKDAMSDAFLKRLCFRKYIKAT